MMFPPSPFPPRFAETNPSHPPKIPSIPVQLLQSITPHHSPSFQSFPSQFKILPILQKPCPSQFKNLNAPTSPQRKGRFLAPLGMTADVPPITHHVLKARTSFASFKNPVNPSSKTPPISRLLGHQLHKEPDQTRYEKCHNDRYQHWDHLATFTPRRYVLCAARRTCQRFRSSCRTRQLTMLMTLPRTHT